MENILFFNPNIHELCESINIGPQAEVFELIEEFNDRYVQGPDHVHRSYNLQAPTKPLGVTKKFYWRPGAYDTIKQILWYQGEMHKKANSLEKVVERVKDHSSWRFRNIKTELYNIESILIDFRQRGIIQQDNSEEAIESFNVLKNHLIEQQANSNNKFTILCTPVTLGDNIIDYSIYVVYTYFNPVIKYNHSDGGDKISEFEFGGDVAIKIKLTLSKLINQLILANQDIKKIKPIIGDQHRNTKRASIFIGGKVISDYGLSHPFVATYNNYNSNLYNEDFRYVCTGNMTDEIHGCLQSLDFISASIFIDRLIRYYDTNTGPLNRLNFAYHGIPNLIDSDNDEHWSIWTKRVSSKCSYSTYLEDMEPEWVEKESYCANYCSYKDKCTVYAQWSNHELSKEITERKALEAATLNAARRQ